VGEPLQAVSETQQKTSVPLSLNPSWRKKRRHFFQLRHPCPARRASVARFSERESVAKQAEFVRSFPNRQSVDEAKADCRSFLRTAERLRSGGLCRSCFLHEREAIASGDCRSASPNPRALAKRANFARVLATESVGESGGLSLGFSEPRASRSGGCRLWYLRYHESVAERGGLSSRLSNRRALPKRRTCRSD